MINQIFVCLEDVKENSFKCLQFQTVHGNIFQLFYLTNSLHSYITKN